MQYSMHQSNRASPGDRSGREGSDIWSRRKSSEALKGIATTAVRSPRSNVPEANSEMTKKKLTLMKLMLKNEKQANELMKRQIMGLSTEMHLKNPTVMESSRIRH